MLRQHAARKGDIGPVATVPPDGRKEPSPTKPTPSPKSIDNIQHQRMDDGTQRNEEASGSPSPPTVEHRGTSSVRSLSRGTQQSEERLRTRAPMKVISRDKKKEGDRQEAEKKRQLEKTAKVETLRKQAATTPVPADEEMDGACCEYRWGR